MASLSSLLGCFANIACFGMFDAPLGSSLSSRELSGCLFLGVVLLLGIGGVGAFLLLGIGGVGVVLPIGVSISLFFHMSKFLGKILLSVSLVVLRHFFDNTLNETIFVGKEALSWSLACPVLVFAARTHNILMALFASLLIKTLESV